ncbi:MAG: chemotaxis protein CheA [Burkholderiaceae bacterium]
MDDLEMDEVRAVFLEECGENVDLLESGLLQLGDGATDPELLNGIFRAAHSIKGGGATFGFQALSQLTHHMETLLDEMRSGQREVCEGDLEILLQAVDVLRDMLESCNNGGTDDHDQKAAMESKLEALVAAGPSGGAAQLDDANPDEDAAALENEAEPVRWRIALEPKPEMMARGGDPMLLLRELNRLGELSSSVSTSTLPDWEEFNPKTSYLSWELILLTAESEQTIREVFDWVAHDCYLVIEPAPESAAPAIADNPTESATADSVLAPTAAAKATGEAISKAAESASAAPAKKDAKAASGSSPDSSTIRIATEKIDHLINLVGELVITQSMLSRAGGSDGEIDPEQLRERLTQLERNTRELQESVMRVRMLAISSAFGRFPRLVRDLSKKLEKKISLVVVGESTELDKTVLERMTDPLVHLVRNSLDHGLETPEVRVAAGKPETGTLTLNAYHQGSSVVIEIEDDGAGINEERVLAIAREKGIVSESDELTDEQIHNLIFAPGFSTASEVSDLSGRGVGMDVVRRNINDLGGRVNLESKRGQGTKVIIRLPLTLAILDGQLVGVGGQMFVIPILSIIETVEAENAAISVIPGQGEVCRFRGEYITLIRLRDRLSLNDAPGTSKLVIIVDIHGMRAGLAIDAVLGQQQVVIKVLEDNYKAIAGVAGATIMSDGSVALILDPQSLVLNQVQSETV